MTFVVTFDWQQSIERNSPSRLEDEATLLRRADEAAKFAPLNQLGVSPRCGFATNLTGSSLTRDDQRAKLRLVSEVANEVWKQ